MHMRISIRDIQVWPQRVHQTAKALISHQSWIQGVQTAQTIVKIMAQESSYRTHQGYLLHTKGATLEENSTKGTDEFTTSLLSHSFYLSTPPTLSRWTILAQ